MRDHPHLAHIFSTLPHIFGRVEAINQGVMAGNVRRTWDKEAFALKAKERAAQVEAEGDADGDAGSKRATKAPEETKEEFRPAEEGAAGPIGSARAFIKARERTIDTEQNVGRTQIVTAAAMEAGAGAGFWCEVCTCLLKDSSAYLDHVNGKKHQRALGFSMRVERVGPDAVKSRLDALKRKITGISSAGEQNTGASGDRGDETSSAPPSALARLDEAVGSRVLEEETQKRQRKADAEARRKEREAADMEEADPEIAALMGFGGFGGGAKKR